jgi:PAS domain S-box-containing protein
LKKAKSAKRSTTARRATRSLFHELPAEWYWEQDAELRFTKVEARDGSPAEQGLARGSLGKKRWETGLEIEGGWDEHRALLEARKPFRDVLAWRIFDDGGRRYISVTGEPVFDTRRRFTGYRGVGRDVTAQKRVERLLRLEHRVTRCLAESSDTQGGLVGALKAICSTEGWDCGQFWKVEDGSLQRRAVWFAPEDQGAREFADGSGTLTYRPGMGLVGAVWQSGEPLWVGDAAGDPRAFSKEIALATGLRAAVLFPVRSGERVSGVLDFSSRRLRAPHKRLQQALHVIATIIGQYLERAGAEQAVRASEARFRSLTDLSSDMYWEQDAHYRFTQLEGRLVAHSDPGLRARLIGKTRWESGLEVDGGWDAHRALLDARKPFHDALMWRVLSDGTWRYLSVSGEPVFGPDGAFRGYRGVGRDVSAQKRSELLLTLEHHVARSLAEADSASSGLRAVIRAVCGVEGWACGRYYRVDHGVLRFEDAWSEDDPRVREFIVRSREVTFKAGEGLTGTVLQSGEAVWTHDATSDGRTKYGAMWEGTGLRGGIAFPVVSENRIIGVLNFSSQSVREPDQRLLDASRVIGSQIGQFLRRKQAEESLRESEARFRRLTEMSSDFYWETDPAHRATQLVHGPSYPVEVLRGALGKASWDLPSVSPDEAGWAAQRAQMDQHRPFRDFEFARLLGGVTRYFNVSGEPRFASDGRFVGYQGVGRDITETALARERISSLAYSDSLTGLANRTSFGPSLEQAAQRARRKNAKLALVFVDLDGCLRSNLRASDLVARLGGDEFVVAVEEVQEIGPIEIVAKKLLAELVRPYPLASGEVTVTASIGISIFPDDAADAPALLKHADTAMYSAKQAGKNTYRFYSSGPAANDVARRSDAESA